VNIGAIPGELPFSALKVERTEIVSGIFLHHSLRHQPKKKLKMNRISIAIFLSFSVLAPHFVFADIIKEPNITYRKVDDVELKLDMCRPEGEGPFPAIVFIHGGAWHAGSRQSYNYFVRKAAEKGYVAVTISYRLMKFDQSKKENTTAAPTFPAQIHDAKAAVRWLRANAQNYHVDPDRIGVTGGSAGGHLALLVGLAGTDDKLEGEGENLDVSSCVQAVVNMFGPTEMVTEYEGSSVAWVMPLFLGGKPNEVPEQYKAASPVTYVSKDDPPVLTLHGDKDKLVPIQQAKLLDEKMKAVGVPHTLKIFEGHGHGFIGDVGSEAEQLTWDFFEKHLNPAK
jgi:acetyl esterase/lipase